MKELEQVLIETAPAVSSSIRISGLIPYLSESYQSGHEDLLWDLWLLQCQFYAIKDDIRAYMDHGL